MSRTNLVRAAMFWATALGAGLAMLLLVGCGGAPSTATDLMPGESLAVQSTGADGGAIMDDGGTSMGDGGTGTSTGGEGGSWVQVCDTTTVTPVPYPGAVDCSSFDPASDQWPQATQLVAWALSQARDAQGQAALTSVSSSWSEGMSCFTGSMQGQWSFWTYFVTPTLALTQDVTLPMVSNESCGCSMLTFQAGTLVSDVLAQLTGAPYEFTTNAGVADCSPPEGTTEYTGEPCTGGRCGFAE